MRACHSASFRVRPVSAFSGHQQTTDTWAALRAEGGPRRFVMDFRRQDMQDGEREKMLVRAEGRLAEMRRYL